MTFRRRYYHKHGRHQGSADRLHFPHFNQEQFPDLLSEIPPESVRHPRHTGADSSEEANIQQDEMTDLMNLYFNTKSSMVSFCFKKAAFSVETARPDMLRGRGHFVHDKNDSRVIYTSRSTFSRAATKTTLLQRHSLAPPCQHRSFSVVSHCHPHRQEIPD